MGGLNIVSSRKREGRVKMGKVKENIDLSRKVLDVSIDSPVFQPMLKNLDKK